MSNDEYYDAVDGDSLGFGIHEFDPDEDVLEDEHDPLIPKKKVIDDDEDIDVLLKDFDLPDEDPDEFNPDLY